MILDTYIRGVPCLIRVTHYTPGEPPIISGPMDWADPGCPAEIEFDVLDQRGRPAPWLERKLMSEDRRAIEQEIIAAKAAEADEARADALEFNEWGAYA